MAQPVTPATFASALLRRLGIHQTPGAIQALVGWQAAEGGNWHNDAKYNPLNTTLNLPGSGDTGTQGNISVYKDWGQGLEATAKTLANARYSGIRHALAAGDPMAVANAIGGSPWGTSGSLVASAIKSAPLVRGVHPFDGAGAGPTAMPDAGRGQSMASPPPQQGGTGIEAAMQLLLGQQQRPQIQSAGIQAPAFSARPTLPGGYAPPQGGGGPAPAGPDVSSLLALVAGAQQQGGMQPAAGATQQPAARSAGVGGGAGGSVKLAPTANRAGVGLTPGILKVVRAVSAQAGEPLTIGTGTNHNRMTTSGNVSDHWSGNAADIPASGDKLTKLGQDALIAAGMDPAQARKQTGGLFNLPYGKHRRIQVIFNSNVGGNHFNHLHVGVTAK